jgi:hypothetical protein
MNLGAVKTTSSQREGKRHALLICNGTFKEIPHYQLLGPTKDAELLYKVLSDDETCQFEVRKLVDKGLREVRLEIARVCGQADEEDTLLIYYSGNGMTGKDGCFYLLVADSEAEYPFATALDGEFILSQLRSSKCRKIVLIIDGCYSGAFFTNNRGVPNGLYAITSCGAHEMCLDTPAGGAFTVALVAGLRNATADDDGDGHVSIDELHDFVKRRLHAEGHEGTPQKWVWNVPEPIYLASAPSPVFLSYAREDIVVADELFHGLEAEGLSVWIDRQDITSGSWKERVTEGLRQARAMVVLLTLNSLNSAAVRKELSFAAKKHVPIIPVQTQDINEELVPDWYTLDYDELHRHFLDAKNHHDGVRKLAAAIRNVDRSHRRAADNKT